MSSATNDFASASWLCLHFHPAFILRKVLSSFDHRKLKKKICRRNSICTLCQTIFSQPNTLARLRSLEGLQFRRTYEDTILRELNGCLFCARLAYLMDVARNPRGRYLLNGSCFTDEFLRSLPEDRDEFLFRLRKTLFPVTTTVEISNLRYLEIQIAFPQFPHIFFPSRPSGHTVCYTIVAAEGNRMIEPYLFQVAD